MCQSEGTLKSNTMSSQENKPALPEHSFSLNITKPDLKNSGKILAH